MGAYALASLLVRVDAENLDDGKGAWIGGGEATAVFVGGMNVGYLTEVSLLKVSISTGDDLIIVAPSSASRGSDNPARSRANFLTRA